MSRMQDILKKLIELQNYKEGVDAYQIGLELGIDRSTASRYLNMLVKEDKAIKISGKPVKYLAKSYQPVGAQTFKLSEVGQSLQPILEKGLAALLYPSRTLPILLTGETGTGKTYIAETLATLSCKNVKRKTPFIILNCADYAHNAELLLGQIFGIKKGAFTGAFEDQAGLVERANGGTLFLDEIHRLPPSGQEMLFYLIDKGVYRRLGEANQERYAKITLIGATTEEPEKALLPTLLRRFSIKLELPPLRERSREERNALINHFLTEESRKMEMKLSITDDSREALLTYDCPGNIGQLKSDLQIACAFAYMRFLNNNKEKVVIEFTDLPEQVKGFATRRTIEQKDMSAYPTETLPFPSIYQHLSNQHTQEEMKNIINSYIKELTKRYHQPSMVYEGWQHLIDDDLFQALTKAQNELAQTFPSNFNFNQLFVIGLHLQNYRNHYKNNSIMGTLPVLIHPNIEYRQIAIKLARFLQAEIGLKLPDEEIELIAHFLTTKQQRHKTVNQSIAIILVTHGNSTATSMAEVTNTLLGNDVIHAIDMPLHVSATDTYERVKQKINELQHINGALLLVDIGSLITMGTAIQHDLNVPIKTIPCVNLPMVLEAGRKSLIAEMTLEKAYQAAKKAMTLFMENDTEESTLEKKRMIVTVCFTGEGAAQLLEVWIEKQLPILDQDVLIRTVRIDPTTKDISVLKDLKDYYDIISIIGTVPVTIDDIPYIPAWELLQQDGITRMIKLLEVTRKPNITVNQTITEKHEIYSLVSQGLGEIVTCINPKLFTNILNEFIPPIREFYGWDMDRELGMWMHLGSLVDRLVTAHLKQNKEKLLSSIPIDGKIVVSKEEKEVWNPFFIEIEKTYHIDFSTSIKKELIKLSR